MPQTLNRDNNRFDAVVVGSGATGGWAAKELAEAGLTVCVLEAGPKITEADFTEHAQPYEYPYRFEHPAKHIPLPEAKAAS